MNLLLVLQPKKVKQVLHVLLLPLQVLLVLLKDHLHGSGQCLLAERGEFGAGIKAGNTFFHSRA